MMKFFSHGSIEADQLETRSEPERNRLVDADFAADEVLLRESNSVARDGAPSAPTWPGLPLRDRTGLKRIQTGLPLMPVSPSTALSRAYWRAIRAAEMAAWEMTGGDCLLSSYITQA